MNALDVLNEYKTYIKIVARRNGKTQDMEKAKIIIAALEKQIPKKPKTLTYGLLIDYGWKYECPNCGCAVGTNNNLKFAYGEYLEPYENNCCSCGQALDWSEEK